MEKKKSTANKGQLKVLFFGFISLLAFVCDQKPIEVTAESTQKTNIIFILADDLGYGDLGFLGQQFIETPNIDRLAKQGMFFSNFYSGSTVCAPSRSSFLTGLHTGHTPIRGNSEVQPEGQLPMPDSVMTVGKALQQAGYVTGAFGKWGLGFIGTSGEPVNQGFNEFFGYNCQRYAHRYYPDYLWHNNQKVDLPGNDWTKTEDYAPDLIQEKTLAFIDENKDKPFFLFMPIVTPHAELAAPDDEIMAKYKAMFPDEKPFIGGKGADYGPDMRIPGYQSQPYPHATFAAMVERIDRYVGEVLDKLEENGLADNTLIIFSSDNGAHREGGADPEFFDSNGPFRGFKRDLYEGGVRAPMIAWWPGKIKAGTTSDHVAAFWDLLPTFSEVAGNKISESIDGISFVPAMLGHDDQQAKHEYLYWEFHEQGGKQAIRQGNWKAVKLDVFNSETPTLELYDLSQDPGETTNLAASNPEKMAEMEKLMETSHLENPIFKFYRSEKEAAEK